MTSPPVAPAPAATVVLLRPSVGGEPEVLLTHRPATMAFAAGMHVFPGGRVDPGDGDPRLAECSVRTAAGAAHVLGGNETPDAALALHVAACRELWEEAGVLLADGALDRATLDGRRERLLRGEIGLAGALGGFDLRLRTDRLAPIAHWTTPAFMARRFSTWFFVADLPAGAEPSFAADEVVAHRWLTPSAALERRAAGEIEMWVPTTGVLQLLVELGARTAEQVAVRLRLAVATPPRVVQDTADEVRIAFGSAGGVPGRPGTVSVFGRMELVVVDPGDQGEDVFNAILAVAERRRGTFRAIALTVADPSHAAGAEALAIALGVPVLVAPGAGRHLPYPVRELSEGEPLPSDVELVARLGPLGTGRLIVVGGSAGQ